MKHALILCLFACLPLIAQPSVQQSQTFTGAAAGAALSVPATNGAASWRLTFNPTGFTAISIQVESSEDCSGSPCGVWTAVATANVTDGSNPLNWTASPVFSNTIAFRFNHPWLRVNVTGVTGTGSIKTLLLGYRGTQPQ